MKLTPLTKAIRASIGASLLLSVAMPLMAQDTTEEAELEEVIVTGSLIKRADGFESSSPVVVATAADISATGISKIEDYLNSLPQLDAGQNSYISNGASGTASLDLRGMGSSRTLTLINGRRMGGGSAYSSSADTNQIPTAMIERVEVLTGGASTVYGADAVAGVVNFVMRKDFEGVELKMGTSGFQHDNSNSYVAGLMDARGFDYPKGGGGTDGRADTVDLVMGSSFADGKGHATTYVTWRKGSELRQGARDYSSCALNSTGTSCGGSGNAIVPNFYISQLDANGNLDWGSYEYWTLDSGSNFIPSSGNIYNYAPINHFMRPDEKWSVGTMMDLQINDSVELYAEVMATDYNTKAQIAESGTFFAEEYHLPYESALLNDSQRQALTDTWGLGAGDEFAVYIGKRNVEGGPRASVMTNASFRVVLGARGEAAGWDYDVNYQKNSVDSSVTYINDFFAPRIGEALVDNTYSVFTYNGVTSEQANMLTGVAMLRADLSTEIFFAQASRDTGISLPTTDSNIQVAMGVERRDMSYDRDSDTVFEEGMLLGQGGATKSIAGSYSVTDVFFEAAIPVLENLDAELGFRASDYSTSGNHNTYKFGFTYAPSDMVTIRTGYNRTIRSPNITTMFAPQNQGLWAGSDPCAGETPDYTAAQCALTGVTAGQYGSIVASPASQYNALYGGNTEVGPEVADTISFGIVANPIEDLTVSIDWWSVQLEDAIGSVSAATSLKECAENNNAALCALINRGNAGTLWLGTSGYISSTTTNLGEVNFAGVDLIATYGMEVGGGDLALRLNGSRSLERETLVLPGVETTRVDCNGIANDAQCTYPNMDWRHSLSATYSKDDWTVGAAWRYFGSVDYQGSNDVLASDGALDAVSYVDLNGSYTLSENITFSGGARNLLDKEPPMVGGGLNATNANSYGNYDVLGRYVYADVTFSF
ncbi:MAG: iron complex outermembrane receptor protein [Porticoccaceae bacterium]|jgi:iron complex outermembrane receptor protein|tara:strand:+ start:815 stop:3625 length:2811 start_codon:yes stop_codon:yes gene_type:complete